MCIFCLPVESVSSTRIFARVTRDHKQFLAYQMSYESAGVNAMILPLPVARPVREDSLRFINLEGYGAFFDDLDRLFPYTIPAFQVGCGGAEKTSLESLTVFNIGSFIASFVPTISDFERLDPRFRLTTEIWDRLPQYTDFSFAVFQLVEGRSRVHPMAFVFDSASSDVFFPTLHIHDGAVHDSEEFDHILYTQHAGLDSRASSYRGADVEDKDTEWIRSKSAVETECSIELTQGIVEPKLLVHRKLIQGVYPNRDMTYPIAGDPLVPSFNIKPFLRLAPWLLGASALTWFIGRRAKLRRKQTDDLKSSNRSMSQS